MLDSLPITLYISDRC